MPKIFFEDTGLANLLANKTFSMNITGNLLENSIYSQLRKNINDIESLYFWRTNRAQEVDFVIDSTKGLIAIETKSAFLNKYTTHIRYFKDAYSLRKAYFCCLLKQEECRYRDIDVFYPWVIQRILIGEI